jgi:CMP-N-acetylneuraminic acid synthetase
MGKYYQRQLLPPAYRINGSVDVSKPDQVFRNNRLYSGDLRGYVMPVERSIDIDTEIDFYIASWILGRRYFDDSRP